jgi:hypothetical protein
MNVCVINLLTLLGENKDIVNIADSSLWINFDQTMIGIYSDSSISDVIPIEFELKKNYFLFIVILQFNCLF